MRVRDKETGLILESENEHTIAQWVKHPKKYRKLKGAGDVEDPSGDKLPKEDKK